MPEKMTNSENKKSKGFRMPGAFTILFILTIFSVLATWWIPAGSYSKLQFDTASSKLVVTDPNGKTVHVPATQTQLDKMNVKIKIKEFTSGAISKPVSVPNTYKRLKQNPAGIGSVTTSMVNGTIEAVDIMVFIMVLGGMIGVVRKSGAFESGLLALTKKTKGREFLLIFLVSLLMVLGGTLCGIEEEAVAFYPILVPIFLAMGYDSIICVGAIFLASSVGTSFSTINPFSSVIASNAAGISFTEGLSWRTVGCIAGAIFVVVYLYWYAKKIKANPEFSYSYEDRVEFNAKWGMTTNHTPSLFTV
ncbi:YfcC family protein, partial [Streptococcus agalactiae]|nr:YfcC family protein [Streptococcus agalactiae]